MKRSISCSVWSTVYRHSKLCHYICTSIGVISYLVTYFTGLLEILLHRGFSAVANRLSADVVIIGGGHAGCEVSICDKHTEFLETH